MVTEVLNGKDITQIVVQTAFKYGQSPLQMRITSSELLSSLEFEVYQVTVMTRNRPNQVNNQSELVI